MHFIFITFAPSSYVAPMHSYVTNVFVLTILAYTTYSKVTKPRSEFFNAISGIV